MHHPNIQTDSSRKTKLNEMVDEYQGKTGYPLPEMNERKAEELSDMLEKSSNPVQCMFDYTVEEGLLRVVEYLYIEKKASFDRELLTGKGDLENEGIVVIRTGNHEKTLLFLGRMVKYSKLRKEGKRFLYSFNPKYRSELVHY